MKTYFIFLLLIAISNCNTSGFSPSEIYEKHMDNTTKVAIKAATCSGHFQVAQNLCEETDFSNMCYEIISYVLTTCQTQAAPQHTTPKEEEPMTPEEEEISKIKKFEVMKKKLYDECYPELLENYSSTEAVLLIKQALVLLERELRVKK